MADAKDDAKVTEVDSEATEPKADTKPKGKVKKVPTNAEKFERGMAKMAAKGAECDMTLCKDCGNSSGRESTFAGEKMVGCRYWGRGVSPIFSCFAGFKRTV